jgi:hypothetical protein
MTEASRKFRIRLIPATLLRFLAANQFFWSVWLIVCYVVAAVEPIATSGVQTSPPLLIGPRLIWLLLTGAAAFTAGCFLYKGRWIAAALSIVALFLLGYLCLLPVFWGV